MITISFVIPVYNEVERIDKTFKALERGVTFRGIKLEKIIFVNDGSTDRTKFRIQSSKFRIEKATKAKIEIVSYKENRGKGYAIREGLKVSESDYTLFFDTDMSTPLSELNKFVPFMKKGVDFIIGTRKNGHSTVIKHQPFYREMLGRGFTLLSNMILNTWVTDFTCGFKAIKKEVKNLIVFHAKVDRWGYDAEFIFLIKNLGCTIQEIPVKWTNDERSKVNVIKDLPQVLMDLVSIRLANASYKSSSSKKLTLRLENPFEQ
ncbi:MAG: glycosyltransferase [bacterium]|nr:glycosyltransferase [bacterium]